ARSAELLELMTVILNTIPALLPAERQSHAGHDPVNDGSDGALSD
ncbi:MAG: hypothetical protein JWO65_678, partial [Sphingomonas bacterium]|nr:hypothetical protein [Sphingomonas bacterium]